jgi:cytochrome c556
MPRLSYLIPAAALLLGGVALADTHATGRVAYRQHSMSAMAEHMAALKVALTEQPDLIPEVGAHAAAIAATSAFIPTMFPKDGNVVDSAALPSVWDQPGDFAAAAKRNQELAQQLGQVANGGDPKAALAAFAALGRQGCGGCHESFRKAQS